MLRDIQQRFDPTAPMEMLRTIQWAEDGKLVDYHPGDPIPVDLYANPGNKLRTLWSAGFIQRSDWDPETRLHVDLVVEKGKGGWYTVTYPDGTTKKVKGKAKVERIFGGRDGF